MHLADREGRQPGGTCCRSRFHSSLQVRTWLTETASRQTTIKELRKGAQDAKIELEARKQQQQQP